MSLYSALRQVLAPFAAKIKGIQTGYDGTVYPNPGTAVREQIKDLHVMIGDVPGAAIQASAVAYGNSDVGTELTNVKGRLQDVKSALSDFTGITHITGWVEGSYLKTRGETVNLTPEHNSAYRHVIVDCNEYDRFTISGLGGYEPLLWAFADDEYTVLSKSAENLEGTNLLIIAPENAKYLIINDHDKTKDSYKGEFLDIQINEIARTEYVTPEMFHDGISADWTFAVQAAIDFAHARGGLSVLFSAKTYYISQINLKTRVHLIGVSPVGSVLYSNNNVDKMIVIPETTAYCGIHNLHVHGATGTHYGIYVSPRADMVDTENHLFDFGDFATEVSQNIIMIDNIVISGTNSCALYVGANNARGIYNNIDIINANGDGINFSTADSTITNVSLQAYRTPLKLIGSNNKLSNFKIWFGCSSVSAGNPAKCAVYIAGNRNTITNFDIQDICGDGISIGSSAKNNVLSNIILDSIGASDSDYNVSSNSNSCIILRNPSIIISSCRISNFRGVVMPKKILVNDSGETATFTNETFIEIIASAGDSQDQQSVAEYTHNPLVN